MKQLFLTLMLMASVIIAGCRQTSVAGVSSSDEEAAWEATIRRNYSGYRPPRNAAPAEFDNTSTRRSAVIKKPVVAEQELTDAAKSEPRAEAIPVGDTDPMVVVDGAAEVTSTDPDAKSAEKAADEKKAEAKSEVNAADEKKAEAKDEAKKDAVEPPDPTSSTVYVVKSGDTLGGIAKHFYGNARYYEVITRANVDLIKNPNALKPGMKLIIPKL